MRPLVKLTFEAMMSRLRVRFITAQMRKILREVFRNQSISFIYAAQAATKGGQVQTIILKNAGHFDLIYMPSPVWSTIENEVRNLLTLK